MTHFDPSGVATRAAHATALALPYVDLADELARLLTDPFVTVPPRLVQPLPSGGSLFVMPAHDATVAMTKLITYTPGNAVRGLPSIQGDVLVFDVATGRRLCVLDGPTVTARRTAAVSLLAAQRLHARTDGPLLVVGAGVQGLAHVQAMVQGLGLAELWVASRSADSAQALAEEARRLGARAKVVTDADAAAADSAVVVTCTPAREVVLHREPIQGQLLVAVGAFTPQMVELAPAVCHHVHASGQIVVDTADAAHEAGDLLQAGVSVTGLPTLADIVCGRVSASVAKGPVLFKSCGWAGWDLAAARLAVRAPTTQWA